MNAVLQRGRAAGSPVGRGVLAFTLIELLTVISIIAVLAGLVVGLAPAASVRMKEARVRGELASLVTTIEAYKARFGVYPPDNFDGDTGLNDPTRPPLFYELSGVLVDNARKVFLTTDDGRVIQPATVDEWFNREGFVNAVPRTIGASPAEQAKLDQQAKRRLFSRDFKDTQFAEVFRSKTQAGYTDIELLAVGVASDASQPKGKFAGLPWPLKVPAALHPVPTNPGLNPWRYISTNPTNNPNSFDLWAEIPLKAEPVGATWKVTVKVIGNWKGETVVERIY